MRSLQLLLMVIVASFSLPASAQLRVNSPSEWVTTADAPFEGASEKQVGVMRLELVISAEGSVVGCKTVFASGPIPKKAAVCKLIQQRARYRIASDPSGKPVTVTDTISFRFARTAVAVGSDFGGAEPINPESWITQNDYPSESVGSRQQGRVEFSFDVRADGRMKNCNVTSGSGHTILDQITCPLMMARARFKSPKDENGQPSATKGSSAFIWAIP